MEKRTKDPVWLNLAAAREMVEPYDLEEVLGTLQENLIIDEFYVGTKLLRITPREDRPFELAMYFAESTEKGTKKDGDSPGGRGASHLPHIRKPARR